MPTKQEIEAVTAVTPIKGHASISCLILRETDKAILVTCEETGSNEWFPLSQVSYINNIQDSEIADNSAYPDTVHVATWLLDKKNGKPEG